MRERKKTRYGRDQEPSRLPDRLSSVRLKKISVNNLIWSRHSVGECKQGTVKRSSQLVSTPASQEY